MTENEENKEPIEETNEVLTEILKEFVDDDCTLDDPDKLLPKDLEEQMNMNENNYAAKALTGLLAVGMFAIFGGLFYTAIATFNNPPVTIADNKASSADPMVDEIELPKDSKPIKPKDDVDYTDDMSDDHDGLFGDKPDFDPSKEPKE